jgi:tRNA threonylcarbamoyladenosine biosynthesis protein TsaB
VLILGFDTATATVGVALARDGALLAHRRVDGARRHCEVLVPTIEALLREAGVTPVDVEGLAVGTGPGLYTGLRVGVTTGRTLAQVLGVQVVGISTLSSVAAPFATDGRPVVAVVDARRREVFSAVFDPDGAGGLVRRAPDTVGPADAVARALVASGRPTLVVGDGVDAAHETFAAIPDATLVGADGAPPDAVALVDAAAAAFARGEGRAPDAVLPTYLRLSDAEINRGER